MSNPVAPTVVEKLVTKSTAASSLVVGGATDVATTGTGGINAGPIVGTSVSDAGGTLDAVRDGGFTLPSQAALDLMKASSASQWARIPKGTALQALRMNVGATDIEWGTFALQQIYENSGTNVSAIAANVDTFALASSLTIKDTLLVVTKSIMSAGTATGLQLYDSTDSLGLSVATNIATSTIFGYTFINAQTTTAVGGTSIDGATSPFVTITRAVFTTLYTGNWTIALRHAGVAGGTLSWAWNIYRIAGQ